jgi:pectin methylesterase-like acyl-CoA thioesterase
LSQKTTQNATSAICIKRICINASHSEDGLQGPARLGRDWFRLAERLTAKGKAVFEDSTVDESEAGAADPKVALALLARRSENSRMLSYC